MKLPCGCVENVTTYQDGSKLTRIDFCDAHAIEYRNRYSPTSNTDIVRDIHSSIEREKERKGERSPSGQLGTRNAGLARLTKESDQTQESDRSRLSRTSKTLEELSRFHKTLEFPRRTQ